MIPVFFGVPLGASFFWGLVFCITQKRDGELAALFAAVVSMIGLVASLALT